LVPDISSTIADTFFGVLLKLNEILRELPSAGWAHQSDRVLRQRILENTKLLMHDFSSLEEYLGRVLQGVLPTSGKKNKTAQQVKDRLEHASKRQFRAPINFIKHKGFKLKWMDGEADGERTAGFVVAGPIKPNLTGPASRITKDVEEGYGGVRNFVFEAS
jgi:hypothetical protein